MYKYTVFTGGGVAKNAEGASAYVNDWLPLIVLQLQQRRAAVQLAYQIAGMCVVTLFTVTAGKFATLIEVNNNNSCFS